MAVTVKDIEKAIFEKPVAVLLFSDDSKLSSVFRDALDEIKEKHKGLLKDVSIKEFANTTKELDDFLSISWKPVIFFFLEGNLLLLYDLHYNAEIQTDPEKHKEDIKEQILEALKSVVTFNGLISEILFDSANQQAAVH